jgi:hypothetical protein
MFLYQSEIQECFHISQKSKNVFISVRNPRMFLYQSEIQECFYISQKSKNVFVSVRNPRMFLYQSEIQECFYISRKSKNVLFCVSRKWKKAITKEHGFSVVPWRNEKKISDTNTRIYIESKVVPKVVFLCRSEITLLMKVIPETCCAHSIRYLLFLSYPLKLLGHICYFILMQPNTWLPWLILVTDWLKFMSKAVFNYSKIW